RGDVARVYSKLRRSLWIDSKRDRRPAQHDPALCVDDTLDLLYRLLDICRGAMQRLRVFAEDLYLNRLRIARKISDEIAEYAHELDLERRLRRFDLLSQIRFDVLRGAMSIRLQLDEKVTGVWFGHRKPEFKTGAPRVALDFISALEQLLHSFENLVV